MSALWRPGAHGIEDARVLVPMTAADVDAVVAVEAAVYAFPWTRGNFIDSLAAGYVAQWLRAGDDGRLLGYFVAMAGVDEMHLLNITVARTAQRQGHGRYMVARLVERCRLDGALRLWLEVRLGNAAARAAYAQLGFREMGLRPGYYPAAHGARETAVVMSLPIDAHGGGLDALG